MEFEEMKDRIAHIIRAKNLTAAEFATQLGIQPSNISHLLSGRNNPSLEFVKKLKETFPEYNLDWIVFGKGAMTTSEPYRDVEEKAKPEKEANDIPHEEMTDAFAGTLFAAENIEPTIVETPISIQPSKPAQKSALKRIIMVYSDNTFEILESR